MKKLIFIVILIIVALFVSFELKRDSFIVVSSDLAQPISRRVVDIYKVKTQTPLVLKVVNNRKIIDMVSSGKVEFGVISTLTPENRENPDLNYIKMGTDSLVLVINARNPLKTIDKDTVLKIYTKKIKNWKDINGWNKQIYISSEKSGNTVSDAFNRYFGLKNPDQSQTMAGMYISEDTHLTSSAIETMGFVADMPGGIGFTSLSNATYLKNQGMAVKIIPLEGADIELNVIYKKGQEEFEPLKQCLNILNSPEFKEENGHRR